MLKCENSQRQSRYFNSSGSQSLITNSFYFFLVYWYLSDSAQLRTIRNSELREIYYIRRKNATSTMSHSQGIVANHESAPSRLENEKGEEAMPNSL